MKKAIHLLFLLCLANHSVSQCEYNLPRLKLFEDYGNCTQGMRNYKGETVVDAIYEQVHVLKTTHSNYLLVKQEGKYGLLDCNLKMILDANYDYIQLFFPNEKLFIVQKRNKWGIVDMDGHEVLPIEYDKITSTRRLLNEVSIEKNGKMGLIGPDGEFIIPPEFKYLQKLHVKRPANSTIDSYRLFCLDDNWLVGLINLNNEVLIEPEYKSIKVLRGKTFGVNTAIFLEARKDSSTILYDINAKKIIDLPRCDEITVEVTYNYQSQTTDTIVVSRKGTEYLIQNSSKPNKTLKCNREPIFNKGIIIVNSLKNENAILNNNFDTIVSSINPYSIEKLEMSPNADLHFIKSSTNSLPNSTKFGILNSKGEVVLPIDYAWIQTTGNLQNKVFWATKYLGNMDTVTYQRDAVYTIFHADSGFVREIPYRANVYEITGHNFFNPVSRAQYGYGVPVDPLIFLKSHNKIGALDHSGKIIIPFEYDEFVDAYRRPRNANDYGNQPNPIVAYTLKKGKFSGVIDIKGRTLVPFNKKSFVWRYYKNINMTQKRKKFDFTDDDGKVLFHKADSVFLTHFPVEFKVPLNSYQNNVQFKGYPFAIKKKKLYGLKEGKFVLCDTINWPRKGSAAAIGRTMVGHNGRINAKHSTGQLIKCPNFYLLKMSDHAFVLNEDGKKGFKIDSFNVAQIEGEYLLIKLKNKKVGLLAKDGKSWIKVPKYYAIKSGDLADFPKKMWVKTTQMKSNRSNRPPTHTQMKDWYLIDENDNILSGKYPLHHPYGLQFTRSIAYDERFIFQTNEHYGIMDKSFNVILEGEYDEIIQLKDVYYSNFYALKKNNAWQIFHPKHGLYPQKYSNVNVFLKKGVMDVFTSSDSLVAIISLHEDSGLVSLTPFLPLDTFLLNTDVVSLFPFGKSIEIENDVYFNFDEMKPNNFSSKRFPSSKKISYSTFKNWHCYNSRKIKKASDAGTEFTPWQIPYDFEMSIQSSGYSSYSNYTTLYKLNNRSAKEQGYLIKGSRDPRLSSIRNNHSSMVLNDHFFMIQRTYEYFSSPISNYLLADSIVELELYDLLVKSDATEAFLFDYFQKELTKKQVYGIKCPNLPAIFQGLTEKFSFMENGLIFYNPDGSADKNYQIHISYEELVPYLHPDILSLGSW